MDFRRTDINQVTGVVARQFGNACVGLWRCIAPVGMVFMIAMAMASFAIPAAHAQDGNTDPFESRLWDYLIGNNYKNWAPATEQTGDLYNGARHHGPYLKMYLNRTAAGNKSLLPEGSIVVMENYRKDRSLKNVCVMYRASGFNPEAQDWFWVAYNADGTVIEQRQHTAGKPADEDDGYDQHSVSKIAGKPTACIACHQSAGGSDWVFFNDRTATHMLTAGQSAVSDIAESTNR